MKSNLGHRTVYDEEGNPIKVDPHQFQKSLIKEGEQTQPIPGKDAPHHVVFMTRPHEPIAPNLSPKARARHEQSKKDFPHLNLSEGEFVISAIRRHPIGVIGIWSVVSVAIVLLIGGIFVTMGLGGDYAGGMISEAAMPSLAMIFLGLMLLLFLGGVIATIVYEANRFFLTNESVIQHIQASLFVRKEQTISLGNIEDASFAQKSMFEHMLGYGSLRLSTEGDETTYRFNYVANPSKQIALLNNAVESFKNGRPVDPDENN